MAIPLAVAPVVAGLKYLPALGAAIGGVKGFQESGGNLGSAALGSGLGALTLAGLGGPLRFAGAKLAGTGLAARVAPEAFKAGAGAKALMAGMGPAGISQAVKQAGMAAPLAQQMGGAQILSNAIPLGLGAGAALALAPGAGTAAANLAGPTGSAVGRGGQLGAGVIGYTADGAPVYGGAALPPGLGQYGATSPEGMPLDVLGPSGMGRRLELLKTAQTQRDVLRTLLPEIEAASEARSKKEMERQMAAAGIRQNIKTRAAMQERAQTAGLEAGLDALQKAGGALTSQYQYQ
jgi:hypothetical protein